MKDFFVFALVLSVTAFGMDTAGHALQNLKTDMRAIVGAAECNSWATSCSNVNLSPRVQVAESGWIKYTPTPAQIIGN